LRTATLAGASFAGLGLAGKLAFASTAETGKKLGQLLSERRLRPGDPLLTAALASAPVRSVVQTHGREGLGSTFVHATYARTQVEAVAFQLTPKSGPPRLVYAYFQSGRPTDFKLIQLEIVPDAAYTEDSPFSGTARVLAHDESVVGSAVFAGGQVISSSPGAPQSAAANPYGENWSCFGYCLNNDWNNLPWWITVGCILACGGCIGAPELFIPCGACLGCIGGYGIGCFVACWE
jgi:hypothetical protein